MKQFIISLLPWFLKTRAMQFWNMDYTIDKHLCSSTKINSPLYFFFSHMCQTFMRIVPSLLNPYTVISGLELIFQETALSTAIIYSLSTTVIFAQPWYISMEIATNLSLKSVKNSCILMSYFAFP